MRVECALFASFFRVELPAPPTLSAAALSHTEKGKKGSMREKKADAPRFSILSALAFSLTYMRCAPQLFVLFPDRPRIT
jgi:hypothetical protein